MSLIQPTLEDIISLCKRRGFIFQSADIYGGLNGIYDFGHYGVLIKNNLRTAWIQSLRENNTPIVLLEGSLLGPQTVWEASGHVANFHDPMIDCMECKKRFRADDPDIQKGCPSCGKNNWTEVRQFNMMFSTHVGATVESGSIAYLRPETAQAIFINFKNVLSSHRVKIPFGIAQIGKAFRNEITPKQFLFRMREFEQMEMEWFCKPDTSQHYFALWSERRRIFYTKIGINSKKIRLRPHEKTELSHYSSQTSDVEYEFPFGWKELEGIAHRGNFDLSQHSKHSGKDLAVFDEETQSSYIPHVIETSVGADRLFLTVLFDAYHVDEIQGDRRISLKLHPSVAPIKAAFLPLVKKFNEQMFAIYQSIAAVGISVEFDDSGSIGKRYRRQDEIGTPVCFTYDYDSANDNTVTVRNRDTLQQERISIEKIKTYLLDILSQ